jgi:DNA repair exonuclease SbcCD ATPase subunit
MENGEAVVEEGSAPSIEDQMLESISADEGSQPSGSEADVREEDSTDAEENVEAQPEQKKEESVPKKSFLKRVNGLQAAKRKAEARSQQLEDQLHKYHTTLETFKQRLEQTEKRLSEYEDQDPREVELQRMKDQQQYQQKMAKLQKQAAHRRRQHEEQAMIDTKAEEIIDNASELAEKYQTFSPEELVIMYSKVEGGDMKQMARKLNEHRVKKYRQVLAKNGGGKAPKPIRPQGATSAITGTSNEDMVRFLESMGE